MKTATVLINGATVAAAATDGAGHTQTDLNALTVNDAVLHIKVVTDTTTAPGVGKQLEVFYAFSTAAITANTAPAVLASVAKSVVVQIENINNVTREFLTDVITLKARYAYAWYRHRGLNEAVTLTVSVVS